MPADMGSRYVVGGITLDSALPLPELVPAAGASGAPDWTFALHPGRARAPRRGWFHRWTAPRGRLWLSFGRDDDAYVLRFARLATFRVRPDERAIVCEGASLLPARTVRHLLLNQVLPLALAPTRCVLHASATLDEGGAVGFAGETGAGKSTLSAALSQAGATLLSDDALVVDASGPRVRAVPMYAAVRLWPDSLRAVFARAAETYPTVSHYNPKRIVRVAAAAAAAAPLRALCVVAPKAQLRRARAVELIRLSPRDAVMRLMPMAYQLDVRSRAGVHDSFERLAALAERVPVVELHYPWRLSALPDTARELRRALATLS